MDADELEMKILNPSESEKRKAAQDKGYMQTMIFKDILTERKRQDLLHPDFAENKYKQLCIALEELGEAAQALNDADEFRKMNGESSPKVQTADMHAQKELIEAAAVIFRMLERWNK